MGNSRPVMSTCHHTRNFDASSGVLHLQKTGTAPRFLGSLIAAILNPRGMDEPFPQMWNVFEEQTFVIQSNMIEEDKMLVNLSHVTDMRDNAQTKLPGEDRYGQILTDAR